MKEEGEVIYFIRPCNYLDKEGLCTGHARGIKPEICKDFDELTGKSGKKNAYATKNCLCRFRT